MARCPFSPGQHTHAFTRSPSQQQTSPRRCALHGQEETWRLTVAASYSPPPVKGPWGRSPAGHMRPILDSRVGAPAHEAGTVSGSFQLRPDSDLFSIQTLSCRRREAQNCVNSIGMHTPAYNSYAAPTLRYARLQLSRGRARRRVYAWRA